MEFKEMCQAIFVHFIYYFLVEVKNVLTYLLVLHHVTMAALNKRFIMKSVSEIKKNYFNFIYEIYLSM